MAFAYGRAHLSAPLLLLRLLCSASLCCPACSRSPGPRTVAVLAADGSVRKPLLRQEALSAELLQPAAARRPPERRNLTVEDALTAARASEARDDDAVASALARTSLELHLSANETVRVMSAAARASTATTADTLQEGVTSGSLLESVLDAARSAGLSEPQVTRIKSALASIDHRNYVAILNVMKAASNASRPELSTAEKVAAVISASAAANFSRDQVAMAAASATRAALGGAAAVPLAVVARSAAAAGLDVAAQAAAVAAAGAESPRSQMVIADMFNAAREASVPQPVHGLEGGFGYGDGYDSGSLESWEAEAASVGHAVDDEVYDAPIPEQEKRSIVASATLAAANAERPGRLLNGTEGLSHDVVGDLLSLSRAASAAGFSDASSAAMRLRWQDMSPQQRAVAGKVLAAVSAARGLRRKGASSAEKVAAVVRALEDAGVPAHEEATFAAAALRSGVTTEASPEVSGSGAKTVLDDIVDLAKSAGLSPAQQSGILQAVAPLQPAERRAVANVWAAVGNESSPTIDSRTTEKRQTDSTPPPSAFSDSQHLETLNVLVYAAMQAQAPPDVLAKVNALAQNMTPEEQTTAAAAVLNSTRKATSDGAPLPSVAAPISAQQQDHQGKLSNRPMMSNVFESVAAPPSVLADYEATHEGSTGFVFLVRLACDRLLTFVQQAIGKTISNRSTLAIASSLFSFSWPACDGNSQFYDGRARQFAAANFSQTGDCGSITAQSHDPSGLLRLPSNASQDLFWLSGKLRHGENRLLIQIEELVLREFGSDGQESEYSLCGGRLSTYIGCPTEAPVDLVYPAHSVGQASRLCSDDGGEQNSPCFRMQR